MFESLYPDKFQKSTYEIPFEQLYERGYRGILFDIDNTLVPHGAPADDRAIALFQRLRAIGFKTCLISNNREPRVKSFCDQVGSLYIYKAGKPLPKGYVSGMKKMGTTAEDTFLWAIRSLPMCWAQSAPVSSPFWWDRFIRRRRSRLSSNGIWRRSFFISILDLLRKKELKNRGFYYKMNCKNDLEHS